LRNKRAQICCKAVGVERLESKKLKEHLGKAKFFPRAKRMGELSLTVAEDENPRVGSKPSAHVKPDEALFLSRAFL